MKTLVIDNFQGRLTRYADGDITQGYAKYSSSHGYDPFSKPGNLTWLETPTRIDAAGAVITDLIVAARPRLESGITYVYAVGHTGRLYKIKVNDPTTYEPDYDTPVLLTTLVAGTPTFKYGTSIQFYGATEKIYIGHDKGVTSCTFAGGSETVVGVAGSYTASVPRPSVQFAGKMYFGNGKNILEIDSTELVTTYAKLDPAFPSGTQVRDIDVSPDGNYVQIIVSRVSQPDITAVTQDTSSLSSADSYFIFWNGTDAGYTAYNPYNAYSLNANTSFGPFSYTTGYDLGGATVYSGGQKILSLPNSQAPNFNAMFSFGNMMGYAAPEQSDGFQKVSLMGFGAYDREIPEALYRFFRVSAEGDQTDIVQVPVCLIVSNLFYGLSTAGYTDNLVGSAKLYYSTLEYDDTPTTKYKFWRFNTVPTGDGTAISGVYETQNQLFSKKARINEVRLYVEPLVANNEFTVDLIGSDGNPITNGSKTFEVGTNCTAGDDYLWWNPETAPTYTVGVRITNSGSANWTLSKLELDVSDAGK